MKRSQREVVVLISDDESANNNEQPARKSVRREHESTLADDILAIHRKVAKLEKDRLGAIRIAGEAKARAEFLEGLIDKKVDERGNEQRLEELHEKIKQLSIDRDELARKLQEADDREKKQQEKIDKLTGKLAAAGGKERAHLDQVAELVRKLARYEQQQKQPEQPPPPPIAAQLQQSPGIPELLEDPANKAADALLATFAEVDNSTNIFNVHETKGSQSFSHRLAEYALQLSVNKAKDAVRDRGEEWQKRAAKVFKNDKLDCAACEKTFENEEILPHFFAPQHRLKTCPDHRMYYVSLAAFKYWKNKVEQIQNQPDSCDGPEACKEEAKDDEEEGGIVIKEEVL